MTERSARRGPPGLAFFASAGVHLILLLGLGLSAGGRIGEGGMRDGPRQLVLSTRLLTEPVLPDVLQQSSGAATAEPAPGATEAARASVVPPPSIANGEPAPFAPVSELLLAATRGLDEADYLPRASLSKPPMAAVPLQLPWPDVPVAGQIHIGRFRVFIDEQGRVRRIRGEGSPMPDPYVNATVNAFLAARFEAGELQGKSVKCWIRIEVEFDGRGTATARPLDD